MINKKRKIPNLEIDDARLIYRNFEGREQMFNNKGNRNFGVLISPEQAEILKREGWNVKYRKPDEDGFEQPWIKVRVRFDPFPPKEVKLISGGVITELGENEIQLLDKVEIEKVDLTISPSQWAMHDGKTGISAYLRSIYVTAVEDRFQRKYRNVPIDSSGNGDPF